MYISHSPFWLRWIYPSVLWHKSRNEKSIYLSFDDGPIPVVTPFVLNTLKIFNAKATFFCIGKNVVSYPEVYNRILAEGHTTGNHTYNHVNAWKEKDEVFLKDVQDAMEVIDSKMFRPPYGKITRFQIKQLAKPRFSLTPVMWNVISGDFDNGITPAKCLDNVLLNTTPGSIVVFHDSEKAFDNLRYALPITLEHFYNKGFSFKSIML